MCRPRSPTLCRDVARFRRKVSLLLRNFCNASVIILYALVLNLKFKYVDFGRLDWIFAEFRRMEVALTITREKNIVGKFTVDTDKDFIFVLYIFFN